jgi:membrane protease YdiL (CAAX protease family)
VAANIVVGLAANSTLDFFEEVGWRAWMLPQLMERMSARRAVVVSALIWAFWHAPFAIGGIHDLPGIPPLLIVVIGPVAITGAGLVIGWLWVRTGSIWIVALAHGAFNNWGQYAFKFMGDEGPGGEPRDMLVMLAGGAALVVVGIILLTRGLPASLLRPEGSGAAVSQARVGAPD